MRFSIDEDAGTHIVGWIMPDHPSATPHVKIFIGGEMRRIIPATVLRPLLREHGLHDTGICGFYIDEQHVPGLAQIPEVELHDEATNVRIYRRRPKSATAEGKLFRLETRLLPQAALNEPLQNLFHMVFTRLERTPEEAARSIIALPFSSSVYCTGRLFFRSYEPLLRHVNFTCSVLIRDPFEELAEQLLVLRWAVKTPNLAYSVLTEGMRPLLDSLAGATVEEMSDLETWLGTLTSAQRKLLVSPLTRLLTCQTSDDQLETSAVEKALQTLSEIDVVGHSNEVDVYWETLAAVLGVDLPPPPQLVWSRQVGELSDLVRDWPSAQELLAMDAEVYADVGDAFRRADDAIDEAPAEVVSADKTRT